MTKRCGDCGETKPQAAFSRDRTRADGLSWCCRTCRAAMVGRRVQRRRPPACAPCQAGQHGRACLGVRGACRCRCRPMLGLDGPFELADPTAATLAEPPDPDEEWVA